MAATKQTEKPVQIHVNQITVPFFVRNDRTDDRTLYFAELYEAGKALPPLLVTEDYRLIDGRHRLEALKLLNVELVEALIFRGQHSEAELIAEAFNANVSDAPQPPTPKDCIYV